MTRLLSENASGVELIINGVHVDAVSMRQCTLHASCVYSM